MERIRLIIDLESELDHNATVEMVCNTLDAISVFELEACYHRELDADEVEPEYPTPEQAATVWAWLTTGGALLALAIGLWIGFLLGRSL